MWLAAGSALATTVAVNWYVGVRHGSWAPHGDMLNHGAVSSWLRTLPWWDWRGWSDWFAGGQAIGVHYPPLGHAWTRFTHLFHGQMAAAALGLLVLLPWGARRVARACGCTPNEQSGAVAAVLVLAAASAGMYVLLGFQSLLYFGSWPRMLATVTGLFCAAWSAECRWPLACGALAGIAVLLNASVVPGIAVACAALLMSSGASFSQGIRWAATAGSAALTVCAWWLVPFMHGWSRLVHWDLPLAVSWRGLGGLWPIAILGATGLTAAWAARVGSRGSRRLACAAALGLLATILGDLFDYLRPERWLAHSVLLAAVAAGALAGRRADESETAPVRPVWILLGLAFLLVFGVITQRLEVFPLALWLAASSPRRAWVWGGALTWAVVLLTVPVFALLSNAAPPDDSPPAPADAAAASSLDGEGGLIFTRLKPTEDGCSWIDGRSDPWRTAAQSGGRVRPLWTGFKETSAAAEFLAPEHSLLLGHFGPRSPERPHWLDAWQSAGQPRLDTPEAARALGARWYATCDDYGNVTLTRLPSVSAYGVTTTPLPDEQSWHEAATAWWVALASGSAGSDAGVPLLAPAGAGGAYPSTQAASGVALEAGRDSLTVRADSAGWAWLRVPWDPYWQSASGTPVLKGGPGHLVVWVQRGTTELSWAVPTAVDVAAAAATAAGLLAAAGLTPVNRRRGFELDPRRRRPVQQALGVFTDTVDEWWQAASGRAKRSTAKRGLKPHDGIT